MYLTRRQRALAIGVALAVGALGCSGLAAATPTTSQLAAQIKAGLSITSVPSDLTPSLQAASSELGSVKVDSAGYILQSCDPYWTHALATHPKPCWYGDLKSKRTVVLWGDSNAGGWVPTLDYLLKRLKLRLALFGFIGCDASFVPETSTQKGFPGEWELCNEWHASLPAAVRQLKPVVVMDSSTMLGRIGDATYNTAWVNGMVSAFQELTKGNPHAVRLEMQTIPSRVESAPTCLAANPTDVQQCDTDLTNAQDMYPTVDQRDQQIASEARATLIPTWPLLCYKEECPPIVGNELTLVDADHLSTPYAKDLTKALSEELQKLVPLLKG